MSDEIKPTTNVGVPQNKHHHFLASYPSSPGHATQGPSEANFPMTSPIDTIDANDGDSLPNSPSKPLELPLPGPFVLPKSPMKSTADRCVFNAFKNRWILFARATEEHLEIKIKTRRYYTYL